MEIIEDITIEQWTPVIYRNIKIGMYEISTFGNIRRSSTGSKLARVPSEKGYLMVALMCNDNKQHTFKLHRIMAFCWLGPPPFEHAEVNHIDSNKLNCSKWNLEWTTHLENIRHAYKNNLVPIVKGKDHYNNKNDEATIRLICSMFEFGLKGKDIKRILRRAGYQVEVTLIDDLSKKRTWKHIASEFNY